MLAEGKANAYLDFWDQSYYKNTKILLCFLGLWPYQTTRELILRRGFVAILVTMQFIPQFIAVRRYYNDFDGIMESSGPFVVDGVSTLNVITYVANFKKMRHLLDDIKENWDTVTDKYGKHLFHTYADFYQRLAICYAVLIYVPTIIFTSEPLQLEFVNLIFRLNKTIPLFFMEMDYLGINIDKYRYLLIVKSIIAVVLIISALVTLDLLFFLYAQHLCGLFAALGYAIENIPTSTTGCNEFAFDEEFEHMRNCIQMHNRAIRFSRRLEDIYVWNYIVLLGFNMIVMSLTAFQVVINVGEIAKLIKNITMVAAEIGHLYILCFISQKIMDHSLDIQTHIENSNWIRCSIRSQKIIKLLMMRGQIPCQLTAGKMIIMSLETFTVIIKTSASYFTVFLAMR